MQSYSRVALIWGCTYSKLKAMMKCFSWNLTVHFLLGETCAKTEQGIFWLSPFVSSGTFQLLYHPSDPFLIWVYELQRGRAHILHTKWLAPGSLEKSKCTRKRSWWKNSSAPINFFPNAALIRVNTYISWDGLVCSIAEYVYELCRILTSP